MSEFFYNKHIFIYYLYDFNIFKESNTKKMKNKNTGGEMCSGGKKCLPKISGPNPWNLYHLLYLEKGSLLMRLRVLARGDYHEITCILLRRRQRSNCTERGRWERDLKMLVLKDGGVQPWAKECWPPPETGRGKKLTNPYSPQGAQSCQHFDVWLSDTNFRLLDSRTVR